MKYALPFAALLIALACFYLAKPDCKKVDRIISSQTRKGMRMVTTAKKDKVGPSFPIEITNETIVKTEEIQHGVCGYLGEN